MAAAVDDGAWTRETVSVRVREAWDTLRRLPARGPDGFRATWPAVVQDYHDAYGYTAARVRLSPASPQAIDRMHETFGWFAFVGERDLTRALWLTCGCGMGPHRAGGLMGVHRNTVRNRRDQALDLILRGLTHKCS